MQSKLKTLATIPSLMLALSKYTTVGNYIESVYVNRLCILICD